MILKRAAEFILYTHCQVIEVGDEAGNFLAGSKLIVHLLISFSIFIQLIISKLKNEEVIRFLYIFCLVMRNTS